MNKEQVFIELAKEFEQKQDELNQLRDRLNAAMADVGIGNYAQDLNTLAVYKVVEPTGTFTYYRKIDYKRTALDGERGGVVLSKKEAQEAGFTL